MPLTIPDDPRALSHALAQDIVEALQLRCRAHHARTLREMKHAGRAAREVRIVCYCGFPSIGNGGSLCRALTVLAEGGDEAQWIERAKALRDALEAAQQPATPTTEGTV